MTNAARPLLFSVQERNKPRWMVPLVTPSPRLRPILLALAVASCLGASGAVAQDFNQLDAQAAVDNAALASGPAAENAIFQIVRMKIPRSDREMGFACGSIMPTAGATTIAEFQSFATELTIEDGELTAQVPLLKLHMPIDDLLPKSICN